MKEIVLTQGKSTQIDDTDFEYLNQWKWRCKKNRNGIFYAVRTQIIDNKLITIQMHNVIMKTPKGVDCDHKDGDGLNNQRFNLRNCTRQQNSQNKRKEQNCTSQYKGVSLLPSGNWKCSIWNPKIKSKEYLGCFSDEFEAAKQYNDKALEYFGEFARINIIKEMI